jgi:uncharacterized membrane protein YidH (DUF202 family)
VTTATVQQKTSSTVRVLSILVIIAGIVLIVTGVFTWFNVSNQLADQNITVADDAENFAGEPVDGPLTAYEQATVINRHALEATGGKTYAELDREDPARQTALTASFLQASLFTSVVAFGVALMAAGIGLVLILLGWALLVLNGADRFEVVIDQDEDEDEADRVGGGR